MAHGRRRARATIPNFTHFHPSLGLDTGDTEVTYGHNASLIIDNEDLTVVRIRMSSGQREIVFRRWN